MKKIKKDEKIVTIIIIVLLMLDQLTKIIFLKKGVATTENGSNNGYYIIMSIIIVLMIFRYILSENSFIKIGTKIVLSFAVAGAIGNAIDRIWKKNVIIFIKMSDSLMVNLAYLYFIVTWVGMAVLLTKNSMKFFEDRKKKKLIQEEFEKNKDNIRGK